MIPATQILIVKLNQMAKICINGDFEGQGQGPNGSGPIVNNEEVICDILTEITSTLFKMFTRLHDKQEKIKAQSNAGQEERQIIQAK